MKRHPFEEWLLDDNPLSVEEASALENHLQNCEPCRQLSESWKAVETELLNAPLIGPRPGFTARWQERLAAEQKALERRQSLAFLGFTIFGAILLFGSLTILAMPLLQNPELLIWAWLYRLGEVASVLHTADAFFGSLFRSVFSIIPFSGWILLVGVMSEMAVLWLVSFRLITNPRRVIR